MYSTAIHEQNQKIAALEEEIIRLKELLNLQLQQRFGKSSEVNKEVTGDTDDNNNPHSNNNINNQTISDLITVAGHTRKKNKGKKGRLLDTAHLPHFQKLYDLPDKDKQCDHCNNSLHLIKQKPTKQLEIIPLKYCVVEHIQFVYGCRCCNTVITAPKPQPPLPKAIAGASLLAEIIINKYQLHQPLYRQSKAMKTQAVIIPDNTLGNWLVNIGVALKPLYDAMWCILEQRYLQVDETPVKILASDKKGYLWTYFAPHVGANGGSVVFELNETRAKEVVTHRLQSFQGLLQTDGYKGYQSLRDKETIVGIGCFTHARRKFSEVVKISNDNHGIAAQMLEKLKPLYQLEQRMKAMGVSFHTRKRLRQKIAKPIVKHIYRWLRSVRNSVPPKTKLGAAIQYTLNQWPYLIAYLRHGMAEIDTNGVENKIRDVALGRKNWLFIGNKDAGIIHAIFFSLITSCIINNINPRVYIHYVITKVHEIRKGNIDPKILLPHTIDTRLLEQFANEQITFAKLIFDSS